MVGEGVAGEPIHMLMVPLFESHGWFFLGFFSGTADFVVFFGDEVSRCHRLVTIWQIVLVKLAPVRRSVTKGSLNIRSIDSITNL